MVFEVDEADHLALCSAVTTVDGDPSERLKTILPAKTLHTSEMATAIEEPTLDNVKEAVDLVLLSNGCRLLRQRLHYSTLGARKIVQALTRVDGSDLDREVGEQLERDVEEGADERRAQRLDAAVVLI